jgi:hypothetical protein
MPRWYVVALEPQRLLAVTAQDRQPPIMTTRARVGQRSGSQQDAAVMQVREVAQVRVLEPLSLLLGEPRRIIWGHQQHNG